MMMTTVEKDESIKIERIETEPFGTNAYIIECRASRESVLIDAPGESDKIAEQLKDSNPQYILITHNHFDHTGALKDLKSRLNIPMAAHPSDADRLPLSPDWLLNDGDVVSFWDIELKVMHTPGHTPGSLCFLKGRYLISGDTIFPGGPGKTDSPAYFQQIIKSLKEKIFVLPDDILVFPGHGESTILKKERDEFAAFSSRPHPPDLCGDVLWLSS